MFKLELILFLHRSHFLDFYKAANSNCFNEEFNSSCDEPYPRRASFSGAGAGLEVELKTDLNDLDFRCATALQGYKVYLNFLIVLILCNGFFLLLKKR